jgi:Patatin-like phospholipase
MAKILVACSGGGMRGAFQVGAIGELTRRGIQVDAWTGVSTGAIQAGFMSQFVMQRAGAEELESLWSGMTSAPIKAGTLRAIWRLATGKPSLFTVEALGALLDQYMLGPPQCPVEIGTASLTSGTYVGVTPVTLAGLKEAIMASAAQPPFLPPVSMGGADAVDGGVVHVAPLGPAFNLANRLWPTQEPVTIVLLHCFPLDADNLRAEPMERRGLGAGPIWKSLPRVIDMLITANERADVSNARLVNQMLLAFRALGSSGPLPRLAQKRIAKLVQVAPTMEPTYAVFEFNKPELLKFIEHGRERMAAVLDAPTEPL